MKKLLSLFTALILMGSMTIVSAATWTVAGDNADVFGTTWAPTNTSNDMTLSGGLYRFVKSVNFSANTAIQFKVCKDHGWGTAYPGSNYNFTIPSGQQTLIITFNENTKVVNPICKGGYIAAHGDMTSSNWATVQFTAASNKETASHTYTLPAGTYHFGMRIGSNDNWTSNGSSFTRTNSSNTIIDASGNCSLVADYDGEYTFTWTYATNELSITYPALPAKSVDFVGLSDQILKGTAVQFEASSTGVTNPGYRYYVKAKGGDYGSAVTSYSFNTVGEYVVKVEALANNTGDPVVSNEKEVTVYTTHTFTNGTVLYVDFAAMSASTKKGVNYPYGDRVDPLDYDANGAGTLKTITFTQNVEWTTLDNLIKTEKANWAGVKFSVPADGQNMIVVAEDGASYTWDKYAPTIKMHGNFLGEWNTTDAFVLAGNKESASIELTVNTKGEKEFGMRIGSDDNWTANGASITRTSSSATIVAGSGNCKLDVDAKGKYTFTWIYDSNTLSVLYPDLPTQTVELTGLDAQILKGTNVVFAAQSSGIDNPGYRYYVKTKGGDYGSAVTSFTFNTIGEYVVKVEALEDNTGDPVASDEKEVAVYATHTFTAGTTIYVDFTAVSGDAKGVNYPFGHVATPGNPLDYDANGAGSLKTITFTENVEWSTSNIFVKTAKSGWQGLNFTIPTSNQNCVRVAADGASYTWDQYIPVPATHIAPIGGKFLINANHDTVVFSRGNLRYDYGAQTWYCSEKQYEVLGVEPNLHFGDPNYTGPVDLFSWSNTNTNYGLINSYKDVDFQGTDPFVDWGNVFTGETQWSTLSKDEMNYLLAHNKWSLLVLHPDADADDEHIVLALFPYDWQMPVGFDFSYRFYNLDDDDATAAHTFSFSQWDVLEAAGAVLIPTSGSRAGFYGNTWNGSSDTGSEFNHVDLVEWYGYYWLSTMHPSKPNEAYYLILPGFSEGDPSTAEDDAWAAPAVWNREKRRGNAVRLVTRLPRQESVIRDGLNDGKWGTLCPKQNVEFVNGATFYQIAYLEEQNGMPYNMVFDEINGTSLTAGKPYFFIASAEAIKGSKVGEALTAAEPGQNGFYGYIGDASWELPYVADYGPTSDNTYVIYNNSVVRINQSSTMIRSERCYINISPSEPTRASVPQNAARRRVTMSVHNTNVATGLDNVQNNNVQCTKVIENGVLYVIKNGTKYNAQGQIIK